LLLLSTPALAMEKSLATQISLVSPLDISLIALRVIIPL